MLYSTHGESGLRQEAWMYIRNARACHGMESENRIPNATRVAALSCNDNGECSKVRHVSYVP